MSVSPDVPCTGPDCGRPARRQGLCWGHLWQARHGRPLQPLAPRRQTKQERLAAAALAFADAETDEEYERAKARLRAAGRSPARCVVEACGRRRYALGLCKAHWRGSIEAFRRAHE